MIYMRCTIKRSRLTSTLEDQWGPKKDKRPGMELFFGQGKKTPEEGKLPT